MLGLRTPGNRRPSDLSRETMDDISAKCHMTAHTESQMSILLIMGLCCASERSRSVRKESSYNHSVLARVGTTMSVPSQL